MNRIVRTKKIVKALLIICLLALTSIIILEQIYIATYNKLEYKPYETKTIIVPYYDFDKPISELKREVDKLYDIPHVTIHKEIKFRNKSAFSDPLLHYVVVDIDLKGLDFVLDYAHELTHIKYQTGNEMWVTYQTFKDLYESDNEMLHIAGLAYGAFIVDNGYENEPKYDCGYYVLEYFNSHSM